MLQITIKDNERLEQEVLETLVELTPEEIVLQTIADLKYKVAIWTATSEEITQLQLLTA